MSILDAFLLGLLQGLTEFLPVSSSGHLVLLQDFLIETKEAQLLLFDVMVHVGTLGAICLVYRRLPCAKDAISYSQSWAILRIFLLLLLVVGHLCAYLEIVIEQ